MIQNTDPTPTEQDRGAIPTSDQILELVLAAARTKNLADHTLTAYRRTWMKIIAWAGVEGLHLGKIQKEEALSFYETLTRDKSPSLHLQVKSALVLLYKVLDAPNPFLDCASPKFRVDTMEIRYHSSSQLARLLLVLRSKEDYYGKLTFHLAEALFFTACRYHEWAELTVDRLVGSGDQVARIKVKGGAFRDLPVSGRLGDSIKEWLEFLSAIRGVRLRGGGIDFAGSMLIFPGRNGKPFCNQAFNKRLANACREIGVPQITAHCLRHTAATLLLNERDKNLREVQTLLGHKSLATTARYTHVDHQRLRNVMDDLGSFGR